MIIKAGTYRFNDVLTALTLEEDVLISFTSLNILTDTDNNSTSGMYAYTDGSSNSYIGFSASESLFFFIDTSNTKNRVYWYSIYPDTWEGVSTIELWASYGANPKNLELLKEQYREITIIADTEVDDAFATWFADNTEAIKPTITKKFTRLYIGKTVASSGGKCFKRLSTEIIDTIVSDDEFVYTLQDDDTYSVTRYKGTKTNVIIPSLCKGKKVSRIGGAVFNNNKNITSIVIPDSVTSIGTQAFNNCTKLINVEMSQCLTRIEYGAFSNCGFSNIEIPNTVTYIGGWAFNICQNLKSLTIPKSVVTLGECVVKNCTSLKTIYCEATSQPSGWDKNWKDNWNATLVWGYNS